jgi:hypothetical protein
MDKFASILFFKLLFNMVKDAKQRYFSTDLYKPITYLIHIFLFLIIFNLSSCGSSPVIYYGSDYIVQESNNFRLYCPYTAEQIENDTLFSITKCLIESEVITGEMFYEQYNIVTENNVKLSEGTGNKNEFINLFYDDAFAYKGNTMVIEFCILSGDTLQFLANTIHGFNTGPVHVFTIIGKFSEFNGCSSLLKIIDRESFKYKEMWY